MYFPLRVAGQDDLIVVIPNPPTAADIEAGESPDDEAGESSNVFSPYRASSSIASIVIESDDDASSNAASENDSTDGEEALPDTQRREPKTITRSGRQVYSPQRLIASTGIWHPSELKLEKGLRTLFELSLANFCHDQIHDLEEMTQSGEFFALPEFGLVGMGIGGGFNNTEELHVLTFDQAMKSSKHREWKDVVS
jgi:hypothetical protein